MKRFCPRWSLVVVVVASSVAGCARKPVEAEGEAAMLARGRHIVEGVAMCNDCHTAMLESGEPDLQHAYMGATLPFRPTTEMPWADVAPMIAGLPTMQDDEAIHFFMTGERPGGVPPRPPMPRYKMSQDEARAVVAFLRSVPPVKERAANQ